MRRGVRKALAVTSLLGLVAVGAVTYFVGPAPASRPPGSASALASARVSAPESLAVHDAARVLPPIQFASASGERSLADFRGRVVVLNLWATWCPPCREEMPTLDALQAELGGEDLAVVALSVDQAGPEIVRDFYADTGVKHLGVYNDASMGVMADVRARGVPTTLVLDRRGREIARLTGSTDWSSPRMLRYLRGVIEAGDTTRTAERGDPAR